MSGSSAIPITAAMISGAPGDPIALGTTSPPSTTLLPPPSTTAPSAPSPATPSSALDTLTNAIYGLQRQMGDLATCVVGVEGRSSSIVHQPPPQYGLPGYSGIPLFLPTASTIVHTMAPQQQMYQPQ